MQSIKGFDPAALQEVIRMEPPVSIRINRQKINDSMSCEQVPWCPEGYYLPQRLTFTFDPLFHAGGYYVQEASSMFLSHIVRSLLTSPVTCLDLCAAPGGKSLLLLDDLPEGSTLVSNEVIRNRSQILVENRTKWGSPHSFVTRDDPATLGKLTHHFDVIVADVPCSGEGMFRKDPESMAEWSPANVSLCASRQRRIIHDIWDALAPEGLLIYSTCTYNTSENEENVDYIVRELGATALSVETPADWHITPPLLHNHPAYRFFPYKTKGEGFFIAVLRKHEDAMSPVRIKKGNPRKQAATLVPQEVKSAIQGKEAYHFDTLRQQMIAYPQHMEETFRHLSTGSNLLAAGIHLGEMKGKDWIPDTALALSTILSSDTFHRLDISWDEAIRYLRKEPVSIPPELPKGYILLTYQNIPLGFVKNLGNRSNNLYPAEWRIRSSYLPGEVKVFSCK